MNLRRPLFELLLTVFALLPLPAAHAIGALAGRLSRLTSSRMKAVIARNLEMCFPDHPPEWRERLATENCAEIGKNFCELGAFWRWNRQRVGQLLVAEHGLPVLQEAMDKNRGVIIAAPHFGAWELIGLILTCRHPMHFLYQPGRQPALDSVIIRARERFGGKCHAISRSGMKQLVSALKRGEIIGVLPDQEPARDSGVFAGFFASPAYTMTFLGNLARRNNSPVVFAAMQRLPAGRGYEIHYLRPDEALYSDDHTTAATELNRCVQRCVEIAPEQYMWNYKRFRTAPEGIGNRYAPDFSTTPDQ